MAMFDMGAETLKLPLEEKLEYEQGSDGRSFGSVYTPEIRRRRFLSHAKIQVQEDGSQRRRRIRVRKASLALRLRVSQILISRWQLTGHT